MGFFRSFPKKSREKSNMGGKGEKMKNVSIVCLALLFVFGCKTRPSQDAAPEDKPPRIRRARGQPRIDGLQTFLEGRRHRMGRLLRRDQLHRRRVRTEGKARRGVPRRGGTFNRLLREGGFDGIEQDMQDQQVRLLDPFRG